MDDRLGLDEHVDAAVVHTEELVCLDDLEPLVHERRGIDGDLRAHRPGGMSQGVGDGDLAQLGGAAAPERAAAAGEDQPLRRRWLTRQALVHGAVLAVHRDQLRTRPRSQRLHERPRGNQALLVCQCQAPSRAERFERDAQAGKSDDAIHNDIGRTGEGSEGVGARHHLDAGGNCRRELCGQFLIADAHDGGPELRGLRSELTHRAVRGQRRDAEAIRLRAHHLQRLSADRTRRAEHRDGCRAHGTTRRRMCRRSTPPAMRTAARRSGRRRRRDRAAGCPCPSR